MPNVQFFMLITTVLLTLLSCMLNSGRNLEQDWNKLWSRRGQFVIFLSIHWDHEIHECRPYKALWFSSNWRTAIDFPTIRWFVRVWYFGYYDGTVAKILEQDQIVFPPVMFTNYPYFPSSSNPMNISLDFALFGGNVNQTNHWLWKSFDTPISD